jgi:hypothetical protein
VSDDVNSWNFLSFQWDYLNRLTQAVTGGLRENMLNSDNRPALAGYQ